MSIRSILVLVRDKLSLHTSTPKKEEDQAMCGSRNEHAIKCIYSAKEAEKYAVEQHEMLLNVWRHSGVVENFKTRQYREERDFSMRRSELLIQQAQACSLLEEHTEV